MEFHHPLASPTPLPGWGGGGCSSEQRWMEVRQLHRSSSWLGPLTNQVGQQMMVVMMLMLMAVLLRVVLLRSALLLEAEVQEDVFPETPGAQP